jgi:hypothetical protein
MLSSPSALSPLSLPLPLPLSLPSVPSLLRNRKEGDRVQRLERKLKREWWEGEGG